MVTTPRRVVPAELDWPLPHPSWELGARLDRELGDPADDAGVHSYRESLRLDEGEEFPAEQLAALDLWGLAEYYVPAQYGGRLTDYQDLSQLIRMLARRDLTVAIAHGKTFLGAAPVFLSGDHAAARRLARLVRRGARVSLGLTERTHGSDILAGELTAENHGDGLRLNGEKWLINNATRGRLLSLLTRTSPTGGPRGFSLVLVDKDELPEGTYRHLPKLRTLGIRGADISGVVLQDAPVGADAVVGGLGGGAELVLRTLQVTRTLCPALSLGAADHALRLAVGFAQERELYGRTLAELPLTRHTLAGAYADLLLCEALNTVAVRSIHALSSELGVTAAVAKYLVPSVVDDIVAELGALLGARSFLADHYAHGRYQKLARDHRIVGIFDGNTMVNLYSLVVQFRALARSFLAPADHRPRLASLFDLERRLPEFDPAQLVLVSRYGSSIMGTLPAAVRALRAEAADRPALARAAALAEEVHRAAHELHERIATCTSTVGDAAPSSFEDARRYSLCFAGAAALGLWLHSHRAAESGPTGELWRDGLWLEAVLDRVLRRQALGGPARRSAPATGGATEADLSERLEARLIEQYQQGSLFSLLPCPVAEGPVSC
ncbi:acyl-CoA dehydrogenase family protein [Streptacidiphilus neutrinimicus]|uniref:acyl-CoA dehydrogenase family protein n=1 Tax=Streptacidiphilus neutrinimicus TaxID=105420 RepID=UPI00126A18F6|nr:acyl-CoA dehydrogenase family protein [Streptacidiphilus neutrinimicus]